MNPSVANSRVAVMGAGAVGSYFGVMLARAGQEVTLIGRPAHVEAIRRDGLLLDTTSFRERVRIGATVDPSAAQDADFVLFCVKTHHTEEASRLLARHLAPRAVVVSLQNGVNNVARIRVASGIEALPAVVYIAVSLPEPGHVKHTHRGELVIGELPRGGNSESSEAARTDPVSALFTAAGVPCRVSLNIEGDLWGKMIVNCAANAVSAVGQTSYGRAIEDPGVREVMTRLIEETVAVARASGVPLPDVDFVTTGLKFIESIGDATSSMAQDIARGRPTEIDSLNGFIAQRGRELGVPVPISRTVYALVKLLENSAAGMEHRQPAKSLS
jgi:2-dehydropantoate 2-reductase